MEILANQVAVTLVGEGKIDERLEIGLDITDVVAGFFPLESDAAHVPAHFDEGLNGAGEFQLALVAGWGVAQCGKNIGIEDIARSDGQVAGGF